MELFEDEIIAALMANNFIKALQLSEEWNRQIPLDNSVSHEKLTAQEAFLVCRLLVNKQERLFKTAFGKERAQLALKVVSQIDNVLMEVRQSQSMISRVYQAMLYVMHQIVADNLAKTLSGQKSFDLDHEDIMQLAKSLIVVQNFKASYEVLGFLLQINPRSALAHLLASHCCYQMRDEENFYLHLREALWVNPEVLDNYWQFVPMGFLNAYWQKILDSPELSALPINIRLRYFALLLEVEGIFKNKRKLAIKELDQIELDFQQKFREYQQHTSLQNEIKPRVLQILSWLVYYHHLSQNYEKFEEFRNYFIDIDHSLWQTFLKKNLSG